MQRSSPNVLIALGERGEFFGIYLIRETDVGGWPSGDAIACQGLATIKAGFEEDVAGAGPLGVNVLTPYFY